MVLQSEENDSAALRIVLIAVFFIAAVAAILLLYFEIPLQTLLTGTLYASAVAALLSLLAIFLLGFLKVIVIFDNHRRARLSDDNQSDTLPYWVNRKISELAKLLTNQKNLVSQIAEATQTPQNVFRKNVRFNQADATTFSSSEEKDLVAIIEFVEKQNGKLQNILDKITVDKSRQNADQTGGGRTTQTTQTQSGGATQTTHQTGYTGGNHPQTNRTTSQISNQNKINTLFEGSNKDNIQSVIKDYTQAVTQPDRQRHFIEKYSPTTLDTQNANARLQNPEVKPIFTKLPQGDFMAIQTSREDLFLIVPKFNFVLKDTNYGTGAVNEVFVCEGYHPGLKYTQIELIKPAVFNHQGDNWSIKAQGTLRLGQGE